MRNFIYKNRSYIAYGVNGSYQILKKVFPNVFTDGIEGLGLNPIRVNLH